jgi:transposase-like protein
MATETHKTPMKWPETLQQAVVYFADPARCLVAAISLRWPDGQVACPTCGSTDVHFIATRRIWRCKGRPHTKKQFSVKVGTIMEDSPIGLDKWMVAMWLLSAAKNGISSYELHRAIGVTQKSAWFMLHRIRLAMHGGPTDPFSGHVEADETFIGGRGRFMHKGRKERVLKGRQSDTFGKVAVFGVLERNTPQRKSRVKTQVVPNIRRWKLQAELQSKIVMGKDTTLYTDALPSYMAKTPKGWRPVDFYIHKVIDHAKAYAEGEVHTNGMENFWSLLKRTIKGTYVSVEPFHLFRYLDEQAFRFNERGLTDAERFRQVANAVVGKRLTYRALTGADFPESHAG